MRGWWRDFTDLVLPPECGGCGRPRTVLCGRCRTALSGAPPVRVRPDPEPPGLPVVHAAAPYADEVRATLLAHKERGALALARPLGEALAGAVRAGLEAWAEAADADQWRVPGAHTAGDERGWLLDARTVGRAQEVPARRAASRRRAGGGGPLLVPVPSARGAVRARGHDAGRRIAFAAAGVLRRGGVAARVVPVLRQRRVVADQAGLGAQERLANLAGALAVAPGGERLLLTGGSVVLVDDLMTTGASLAEAARVVRAALSGARLDGGRISSVSAPAFVYRGERWERRGEQQRNRPVRETVSRRADRVCAAVVGAPPDAFEINRN
ncbi:ComF family protein [Streptomyces sp. 15-116A]|uniref:ComF family protein n=1 Tax=Streptomyces sp. 15-116A TaxID=2259035 RepID=UPI0021B28901|nr:ComF family protein [Streptomyces sp. 15-116A]MCT7355791.1 ComF family protein [Streptomyces sp. 15-116A]